MATSSHLSTARHGRRLQNRDFGSQFVGACAVIVDGFMVVEAIKSVLLLPLTLSAIPGLDGVHDRVTKLRALAFSEDRACLFFLDEVLWEIDRPRLEVVRHGVLFSKVAVEGHEVRMHRRCATDLATLWGEVG